MSKELIVLLHTDLDAWGCMLNIEFKMPNISKKYFFTNYGNIEKIVEDIRDYVNENGNQNILIADVSFGTNKESLHELYNMFPGIKIHIDHHVYPDGFWDEFPDLEVIWDTKKSASLLCNEYFDNKGKNKNLDLITTVVDVYDIWQVNHKFFSFAQDFNEYFWNFDMQVLAALIKENDYNLPDDYVETVNNINDKINADINDFEKRKLIHRYGEVTIAFVNDWFNHINIREMEAEQKIVIGFTSFGIVRIRINEFADYSDESKLKIRKLLSGEEHTGHLNAFTYRIEHVNFEKIMEEAERVVKIISEVMN